MACKYIAFVIFCIMVSSEVNAVSIEYPVYGNWCGPGYPAKGEYPMPIDLIDKACMLHDIQYTECEEVENRLMCEAEADLELVDSLRDDVDKLTRGQLIIANNIGKYFAVQGPVKAISENTKELFIARIQVATELKEVASNALNNISGKLKDMIDGLTYIKDIAVGTVKNIMSMDDNAEERKMVE